MPVASYAAPAEPETYAAEPTAVTYPAPAAQMTHTAATEAMPVTMAAPVSIAPAHMPQVTSYAPMPVAQPDLIGAFAAQNRLPAPAVAALRRPP